MTPSSLVAAFLDERVRNHSAPFDHSELFVPNGAPDFIKIAARDANGNVAPSLGVTIAPVSTPTNGASQLVSGTVDAGSTVALAVDTAASVGPVTVNGNLWSATVSGLVKGVNTVTVSATNLAGDLATAQAAITFVTQPTLTLNPVATPTAASQQTIAGTIEAGVTPVVLVSTAASVDCSAGGSTWSCTLSGLVPGPNAITVIATDILGNLTVRTAVVTFAPGDGDYNLDGKVDISDALGTLGVAVGSAQPTSEQRLHADVAPRPTPNGSVDVADALLILRKVVGVESF